MSYLRTIIKKAGTLIGVRRRLNFIEGANVTLTIADDSVNDEVDITIAAGGGGNLNVSAGTTSNNLTNIVFSNSNGVSFGLNGSTITGSVVGGGGVIATQVYDVGSAGSTGTVTRYAPEDHVHAGINRYGVSNTGNTAGDTGTKHGAFVIAGTNNITLSQSTGGAGIHTVWVSGPTLTQYLTTARGSTDALGLNTAATNVTWTANSAGVSLNAAGYAGTGTTFNGANISASITNNSNGINLSMSVAAPGGGAGATLSTFYQPDHHLTTVGAPINASASILYVPIGNNITATRLGVLGSVSVASAANTSSAGLLYTLSAVILTKNGNTLSSLSSATTAATLNWQSNSTGSMSGARYFTVPINVNATPGNYFVALQLSTRATGHSGAPTTSLGNTISMMGIGSAVLGAFTAAEFGAATNSTNGWFVQGLNSSTGNITQISISNISQIGTFVNRAGVGLKFQA